MMKISEIKKWAKDKGYYVAKNKETNIYHWQKLDDNDANASGTATSVSKVATAIFNHLTDNKWIDHQKEYKANNFIQ